MYARDTERRVFGKFHGNFEFRRREKADVKSDKPLAKIVGNVILRGKDDRESFAPFAIDMTVVEQGVQIFNVTKTLNPFVRADADAMKHGFKKNDIQIEVTEIIFADGTNLKLLDRLPD